MDSRDKNKGENKGDVMRTSKAERERGREKEHNFSARHYVRPYSSFLIPQFLLAGLSLCLSVSACPKSSQSSSHSVFVICHGKNKLVMDDGEL